MQQLMFGESENRQTPPLTGDRLARLQSLKAAVRSAERAVNDAQAELDEADDKAESAAEELESAVNATQAELDEAERAVEELENAVNHAQAELDEAEEELESAVEELENFNTNGTATVTCVSEFGGAMLSRERYLTGAARERIERILYDKEPVGGLLAIAQNYGWEIPEDVRAEAKKQ